MFKTPVENIRHGKTLIGNGISEIKWQLEQIVPNNAEELALTCRPAKYVLPDH
jgi:hypothetical protein